MMKEQYDAAMLKYRTTMAIADEMLSREIISAKDYDRIDRIIAEKYGLSLSSICARKPLIIKGSRGNMTHT